MSDVDGAYPSFSNGILANGKRKYYGDYSMWDTYRAVHPLYNIIAPQQSADMMQSLVTMYEQGGWLPIFPCWNSYTAAMIGDHCSVVLADAYVKGIRDFNVEKAYEGMRKNAFETPASLEDYKNGMGRRALPSYLKYGYIPLEDGVKDAFHQDEQTSRTLEYAFDDFAVAQLAKALGKDQDYQELMRRSENWRHVINPKTGYCDGAMNLRRSQRRRLMAAGLRIISILSIANRISQKVPLAIILGMFLRMWRDLLRCWVARINLRPSSIRCLQRADTGMAMNHVIRLPICMISLINQRRRNSV
jgi:hypothetical protein